MTDHVEELVVNDTGAARSVDAQREAASGGGAAGEVGPGPFHDARRYRKRAQTAEKSLEDTRTELENAKKALAEREQAIASLERRERGARAQARRRRKRKTRCRSRCQRSSAERASQRPAALPEAAATRRVTHSRVRKAAAWQCGGVGARRFLTPDF